MTQSMSVDEALNRVRRVIPSIKGITVSDGGATTQLSSVVVLFTAIKNDPQLCRLIRPVDSSGMLSETGWEELLTACDDVMLDPKAWGSKYHR